LGEGVLNNDVFKEVTMSLDAVIVNQETDTRFFLPSEIQEVEDLTIMHPTSNMTQKNVTTVGSIEPSNPPPQPTIHTS